MFQVSGGGFPRESVVGRPKANAKCQDGGAERAVLAAILRHGADGFMEIEEIVGARDFYWPVNQRIFDILRHLVHERDARTFDEPTILAGAKAQGLGDFAGRAREQEYLASLFAEHVSLDNARSLATVVFKLSMARAAYYTTKAIQKSLEQMTGDEKITDILGLVENPIFDFTSKLTSTNETLVPLGHDFAAQMQTQMTHPVDVVGLPTCFPNWDKAIGGGQRRGTVNLLGARPKAGKSVFCLNVAYHMARAGIPVLLLDTELNRQTQMNRLAALASNVELNRIETGQFGSVPEEREAVLSVREQVESLPITYCSIAGQSLKCVLSLARRWLMKNVGLDDAGQAKPCLLVYDYIKLMNSDDIRSGMQEFQVLGFLLSELHNWALRWGLPIMATVQLNRDGVEKEGGQVIAGSDRILWLCSSFSILKRKLKEELAEDPPANGTHKLVVTDTRYGPAMEPTDYINLKSELKCARFVEGKTWSQELANSATGNTPIEETD